MNDMKKLSEYKEFFYRDRSLEEFLKDPIWSKVYRNIVKNCVARRELTVEEREAADFLILSKNEAAVLLNDVFRRLIAWSNPFLMNIDEIEDDIDRLLGKFDPDDYDERNDMGLNCLYAAFRLRDASLPAPWQLEEAICILKKRMDYNQMSNYSTTMDLGDGRYPLDLTPHPDFEALERRTADWWNEATDYFRQERIRALSRLYEVPQENRRMENLVRKKYDEAPPRPGSNVKLRSHHVTVNEEGNMMLFHRYPEWEGVAKAAVQAEEAEEKAEVGEEKAEEGRLNIQQLILLFMEMLDLTLDPTFTNQSELARLIAAVSGFKFESIRPKIAKGISYDKKQVKQDAQRVASLLEKVKPELAERIRRNIHEN